MTSNDEQIDLLMRRYGRSATSATATEHLDTDEMNAFAEGALPAAARSRYVSHLADCDQCRQQIVQLSINAGAAIRGEKSAPAKPESRTLWQMLTGMFALPVLPYAAFAAVVLVVAGVAYIALRPRSDANLTASSQRVEEHPASALKAPQVESNGNAQTSAAQGAALPTLAATPSAQNPKRDDSRVAENVAPAVAAKEAPARSASTESKAGESQAYKMSPSSPSYAPPPPGESQAAAQEQRGATGGVYSQKKAEGADKIASADRERDLAKDAGRADDARIVTMNQPVPMPRKPADEKQRGGPSRNMDNQANRAQNESRAEPPKTQSGAGKQSSEEESSETRSVGGHKFRRQGGAWIDQKFKSSMTIKSISRGSDEFKELDSSLRSIAQQFSGEVIVVWKSKAYLIK